MELATLQASLTQQEEREDRSAPASPRSPRTGAGRQSMAARQSVAARANKSVLLAQPKSVRKREPPDTKGHHLRVPREHCHLPDQP